MMLFRSEQLRAAFHTLHWRSLAFSLLLLVLVELTRAHVPDSAERLLLLIARAWVALTLSNFLLWSSSRFLAADSALVRYFSQASYTIYLFHFLVIYLIATLARDWLTNAYALYAVASLGTLLITASLHHGVIGSVPLLRLLCNGKIR